MKRLAFLFALLPLALMATTNKQIMERLDKFEQQYLQDREALKDALEVIGSQHAANAQMMDVRFHTLELLLGMGKPIQPPQPEPKPEPELTHTPQLFMAPLPRYMRSEEERERVVAHMLQSGLTGLHVVVQTDWFTLDGPLDFESLGVVDSVCEETFQILADLHDRLNVHGAHLHVWLWGDSDYWLNPIRLQGPYGSMERMVYDRLNSYFNSLAENVTYGIGWDCEEWLSLEHCKQIVDHLVQPVSARGLSPDQYNDLTDIPSLMILRHTAAELEAFRAQYPRDKYPLIIAEDRCRQYAFDYTVPPYSQWAHHYAERHHTREQQQEAYDAAQRLGIMVIFGRIGEGSEDRGSLLFGQPFNYREIGWQP